MRRFELDKAEETKAYYRLLRHLLTEEVQASFKKEEQPPLPSRMSELVQRLKDTPGNKQEQ